MKEILRKREQEFLEEDSDRKLFGWMDIYDKGEISYFTEGRYAIFEDISDYEYILVDNDNDPSTHSNYNSLMEFFLSNVDKSSYIKFTKLSDINKQSAPVISNIIETKGETTMNKTTNTFGVKMGIIGTHSDISIDVDGNLGLALPSGQMAFLSSNDFIKDLGAINNDVLMLMLEPTNIEDLKTGDLIEDETTGRPMFVKTVNVGKNEIGLHDIVKDDKVSRTVRKNPMLGKAIATKYVNMFTLIGDKMTGLLPLIGAYGEDKVLGLVYQQVIRGGDVDVQGIEMELNPAIAQSNLTRTLSEFVGAIGQGKSIEQDKKDLAEERAKLDLERAEFEKIKAEFNKG